LAGVIIAVSTTLAADWLAEEFPLLEHAATDMRAIPAAADATNDRLLFISVVDPTSLSSQDSHVGRTWDEHPCRRTRVATLHRESLARSW
jgi:hypothetical protein